MKYITFDADAFDEWQRRNNIYNEFPPPMPIADAVTMRLQDVFAVAGLRGYAYAMLTAVDVVGDRMTDDERNNLYEIADYFMQMAEKAQAMDYRKVPD